mgnify:FL=1
MKIGKLSESALQKVVFEQLHTRRDEVLVGPGIGEDCAALKLQEGEVFVTSTDPITGTVKEIGRLAVHVTANDLASAGAETIGLMVTATSATNDQGSTDQEDDAADQCRV